MKISAQDLDRILQNALLYTNKKAVSLREVFFVFLDNRLHSYASDDYVVLTDSAEVEEYSKGFEFSLSIEDAEDLGAWVKKDRKTVHKYYIEIRQKFTGIVFECDETSTDDNPDNVFFSYVPTSHENWDLAMEFLDTEDPTLRVVEGFALRPDRVAKMARLKADKEAPIDFRGIDYNGHLLLQFRLGDTIIGAVRPVTRELVDDRYLW